MSNSPSPSPTPPSPIEYDGDSLLIDFAAMQVGRVYPIVYRGEPAFAIRQPHDRLGLYRPDANFSRS